MSDVTTTLKEFKRDIESAKNLDSLEIIETKYLGKKGKINELLQSIGILNQNERKELGSEVNKLKATIIQLIGQKRTRLAGSETSDSFIDVTLPGKRYPKGSLHLVTHAIEEISAIFARIGFILESNKDRWHVPKSVIEEMQLYSPKSATRFFPGIPGKLEKAR